MHAMPILLVILCILASAFGFYSRFLARRVLRLDDSIITPANRLADGQNFHPTSKWVLFGHHFAAISGAGPLIGPVLAAQFGYMPGLLWIVIGVCLAGAVQDFLVLAMSIRHDGKSLAQIAYAEVGKVAGVAATVAILFIIVIALAGLGSVVVQALGGETVLLDDGSKGIIRGSTWGMFTIACTIPIALFVGWYMYRFRKGKVVEASLIGGALTLAATAAGGWVSQHAVADWFNLSRPGVVWAMAVYGFVAAVLPVWILLAPRDYLSSFLKIGTITLLVIGTLVANPQLQTPAFSRAFWHNGPIIKGDIFPFLFITIMCGAISGFHALVSSGTTPKMISKESDARAIGYGAMLVEGLVGVVAMIAAASLAPADYYAINTSLFDAHTPAIHDRLHAIGWDVDHLNVYNERTQETLRGRPGGAVTLAVGMACIFDKALARVGVGIEAMWKYWYHFAIMFEALFILTTIDAGTRIGRFLLQEVMGRIHPRLGRPNWWPGAIFSTAVIVLSWAYFMNSNSFGAIWKMFGIANQLLAVIALTVVSMWLMNTGRQRYVWVTMLPLCFVCFTTSTAAWEILGGCIDTLRTQHAKALPDMGVVRNTLISGGLIVAMLACTYIIMIGGVMRQMASRPQPAADAETNAVETLA